MKNNAILFALLAGILTGCATPEKVILLPQEDGSPSAVVVHAKSGERVLDQPYAVANVGASGIQAGATDAEAVRKRYRPVLEALPVRARSYTLNFEFSKTTLTKESRALLDTILKEMQELPAPELIIIGYTDDMGDPVYNDRLSFERAQSVLTLLKSRGIAPRDVSVVGRGARDALFPAKRGVSEPRNRRVEIRVK